ncbi:MAG TPA: hypothetical protein VMS71_03480, partial [Candidatus Acidoferrum sp.]|nr:hypothetical protein [Candidatus Acidoferrum sp.]
HLLIPPQPFSGFGLGQIDNFRESPGGRNIIGIRAKTTPDFVIQTKTAAPSGVAVNRSSDKVTYDGTYARTFL